MRGLHTPPRRIGELDLGAARDRNDVRERQRFPHSDRHGGKATPRPEAMQWHAQPSSRRAGSASSVTDPSVPRSTRYARARASDATTSATSVPT